MKPISLFIDTTTESCVIALYQDYQLFDYSITPTNKNLTDLVVEIIEGILFKHHLQYNNLHSIYLNNGPGSFTGVRVSSIIAKTISFSFNNIKLYYCDSLRIYANHNDNCLVFLDAKGKKSYCLEIVDNQSKEYQMIENHLLEEMINKSSKKTINANQINFIDLIKNLNFQNFKQTTWKELEINYVKQPIS